MRQAVGTGGGGKFHPHTSCTAKGVRTYMRVPRVKHCVKTIMYVVAKMQFKSICNCFEAHEKNVQTACIVLISRKK